MSDSKVSVHASETERLTDVSDSSDAFGQVESGRIGRIRTIRTHLRMLMEQCGKNKIANLVGAAMAVALGENRVDFVALCTGNAPSRLRSNQSTLKTVNWRNRQRTENPSVPRLRRSAPSSARSLASRTIPAVLA